MKHKLEIAVAILATALEILAIEKTQAADLGMKDSPSRAPVSAAANDAVDWSGIYLGGQVGYGNGNHDVSAQGWHGSCSGIEGSAYSEKTCSAKGGEWSYEASDGGSAFVDGFNSHGAFAGLRIGADIQRGHWVFGAFGDYNFSNAKMTAGFGPSDGFRGSIEDGDSWLAAGRVGYLFGEEKRAMFYVLGGYGQQDVSYHGNFGGSVEEFKKDATFSGFVAGAGAEYALTKTVFFGIEYQHFFGGKENIFDSRPDGNCEALTIDDKLSSDKVMGRISFKFGPGALGY